MKNKKSDDHLDLVKEMSRRTVKENQKFAREKWWKNHWTDVAELSLSIAAIIISIIALCR